MIWYTIFRFGFAVIFVGLHGAMIIGLVREWLRDKRICLGTERLALSPLPTVSVIIPVHNESLRIGGLLKSLALQDYPGVEYIFIDDHSSDESPRMLLDFAAACSSPGTRAAKVHIITLQENPGPNHKQYALGRGIEIAFGEFILFTDADCEVPRSWIFSMVARMQADARTGIAIGPVFKRPEASPGVVHSTGFFHLYQCFDHAIRYLYLAGSTGLGAAGGGFGNNLILRRAVLEAIGGYDTVPPSPTEDAALISQVRSCSAYKIRSVCGQDAHVITSRETSWKDFINQTLRWNNGGLFSPDPFTRFNFGFLMITISMGIIAIPLLPFFPSLWPLSAAVLLAMTGNTIATLSLFGSSLPKAGAAYLLQLVFTPIYFTYLTILGFCGVKVHWKGTPVS
ncbi:MAG: glycosyltransferase [Treponema sp.]|nr:glycosyltransferase [Treponema sp.]